MCNKSQRSTMACILLMLWSMHAHADDIPAMPPAPDSLLVSDMLRIDAQRARAAELAKAATLSNATMPALPANLRGVPGLPLSNPEPISPPASLSAIYGVGKQLYADVRIHGKTVTYATGRAQPIRASQTNTRYRLRAIRPPCVQLDAHKTGVKPTAPTLELCLGHAP